MSDEKNPVGRPRKYESVEEMQIIIEKYFADCDARHRPYTVTGLALALDMTRDGLIGYENRNEFADTIKRAKLKVENYAEESLHEAKNPAGVIFSLKNNYNWKDKQELGIDIAGGVVIKWEE